MFTAISRAMAIKPLPRMFRVTGSTRIPVSFPPQEQARRRLDGCLPAHRDESRGGLLFYHRRAVECLSRGKCRPPEEPAGEDGAADGHLRELRLPRRPGFD